MKKVLWSFAVVVTVSIIVIACQKRDTLSNSTETAFDEKAVKEWYYGSFKKSAEWASYNASVNGHRLPDWENGIHSKTGTMEIVEFPFTKDKINVTVTSRDLLTNENKKRIAEASVSKILLIKNKSGNIQVRDVQYIPDLDYLTTHNFDITDNSIGNIADDFSGSIVTRSWSGEELTRVLLKNGKITGAFKKPLIQSGTLTDACPIGSIQVTEYARDCESHLYGDGMFTYQCDEWYPTGNEYCIEDDEVFQDPNCSDPDSQQCSCSLLGVCDDPGGSPDPDPVPEIINNVNDPCIRNSVNEAIDGGCKNKITSFVNNTFTNSNQFHLQFNDGVLQGANSGTDAYTICGPMPSDPSQFKTIITFNTSQLVNASKEYIAATPLHESIHAWIDNVFPNPVEAQQQHQMMANSNRFNLMRDALMEMYPNISLQDATDLTWGGLFNTVQFMNLSPAEQARIVQKNLDYKNHTLGTPC